MKIKKLFKKTVPVIWVMVFFSLGIRLAVFSYESLFKQGSFEATLIYALAYIGALLFTGFLWIIVGNTLRREEISEGDKLITLQLMKIDEHLVCVLEELKKSKDMGSQK